jgi:glutamine amidotransferase
MCRFAAYLGPDAPLSTLLFDTPRSLSVLAYDPREQHYGYVNVDGTGLAWWAPDAPEPLRYRIDRPPWQDANLGTLARRLHAGSQLAAVRSATPGIGQGPGFVHPYTWGRLAGTHNGFIGSFKAATARPLIAQLPEHVFAALEVMSDAQVLFLLAACAYERDPDAGVTAAVADACARVAKVCEAHGADATLNLVVGDGTTFAAARLSVGVASNSLYTLAGTDRFRGGCLVASEPLDEDDGWELVPHGHVAGLSPAGVRVDALE